MKVFFQGTFIEESNQPIPSPNARWKWRMAPFEEDSFLRRVPFKLPYEPWPEGLYREYIGVIERDTNCLDYGSC